MAAWEDELSDTSLLSVPLLQPASPQPRPAGRRPHFNQMLRELRRAVGSMFAATTDAAFIRSEVNGRRSRRIVLFAFFCTDLIGATLWATWCQSWWGRPADGAEEPAEAIIDQVRACKSLGINHFVLLAFIVPIEGAMLFLAGRNPWSFWSDGLLLPVWLVRLVLFDVLVWNVPPQTLVVDALWFSIMAVMCRVHSLALTILVISQVVSLLVVFRWHGALILDDLDHMRYGIYSISMLIIMAGAYVLDEQSRLQSFSQLMSLQDENAALAERMLRWKVLPGSSSQELDDRPACDLSPSRLFRMPNMNMVSSLAAGAWNRLTTPPDAALNMGPCQRLTTPEAPTCSSFSEQSTSDLAQLAEPSGAAASGSPRPRSRATERRGSGERRSVRFSLPQAKSSEQRHVVPTRKPLAGFGLSSSSRPQRALDLMDVME